MIERVNPGFTESINQGVNQVRIFVTNSLERGLNDLKEAFATQLSAFVAEFGTGIRSVVNQYLVNLASGIVQEGTVLFSLLPDTRDLVQLFDEMNQYVDRAKTIFSHSDYAFAGDRVTLEFIIPLANLQGQTQAAVITNRFLALTRSAHFFDVLQSRCSSSTLLRKRWPILEQALQAHRQRNYLISIPTLLAQLEGIIGDTLRLRNIVTADGYILRLTQNQDKVGGLQQLLQTSFNRPSYFDEAASHMLMTIVPHRNAILHGRYLKYGKARISTQLLLLIDMFVHDVAVVENQLIWEHLPPLA